MLVLCQVYVVSNSDAAGYTQFNVNNTTDNSETIKNSLTQQKTGINGLQPQEHGLT